MHPGVRAVSCTRLSSTPSACQVQTTAVKSLFASMSEVIADAQVLLCNR